MIVYYVDNSIHQIPSFIYIAKVLGGIVLTDGADFDAEAFAAFLAGQPDLGPKQWPSYVRIATALPRTETFKVLKRDLIAQGTECAEPVWTIAP